MICCDTCKKEKDRYNSIIPVWIDVTYFANLIFCSAKCLIEYFKEKEEVQDEQV